MSHRFAWNQFNRRQFLQLSGYVAGAAALSGCIAPQPGATGAKSAGTEAANALYGYEFAKNKEQWAHLPADHQPGTMISQADWYAMLGDAPQEPLELTLFKGGFGEEWGQIFVQLMEKEHPGVKLNLTFDPTIWEKTQPKLVAGEVPEFMFYTIGPWGGEWKKGVEEHLVMPGDFLLDVEAYGTWNGQRIGELFNPGALESAQKGLTDHTWSFPQTQFTYGIFYNAALFEENGWPAPDTLTWEEFMDLQAEIAKVLPPWSYAGIYNYFNWLTVPLLYKTVGDEAWIDMHNLKPGAFLNEELIWAAEQHQQIIKNGWGIAGSDALDHTQSQQLFVDGKVAMCPNGSWLENEQRSTTPAGFRMKFSGVPKPKDGKGNKDAIEGNLGDSDMQIGNSKNPLWGMELMRLFYSPEMADFWGSKIGSPLPLKNAAQGKVSDYTISITEALKKANGQLIHTYYTGYEAIGKVSGDNYADMIHGNLAAKDYWAMMERAAEETRNDANVVKQTYTGI